MHVKATVRRLRVTIVAVEKQKALHALSECVFAASLIQRAKRTCPVGGRGGGGGHWTKNVCSDFLNHFCLKQ
jgi:homoserine dehydrogenase